MVASMYAMNLSFNSSFNTVDSNDQLADRIITLAGKVLVALPEINAAFEKAELSYSKVCAMTRVATVENELS
jgi:hypothetical protein